MDDNQVNASSTSANNPSEKEAYSQLKTRLSQLSLTMNAIRNLSTGISGEGTLARLISQIRDRFGLYHISLFLLDEQKKNLVLEAGSGETGTKMKLRGLKIETSGQSLISQAISTNKYYLVSDIKSDPLYINNPLLPETTSELIIPMESNGNVVGVLDIYSKDMTPFSMDEISIFEMIANEVGYALSVSNSIKMNIERLRKNQVFYDITSSVTTSTEMGRALQATSDNLFKAIPQSQISIFMLDSEDTLFIRTSTGYENIDTSAIRIRKGEGVVGLVAKTLRPLRLEDTQGDARFIPIDKEIRSEIAVPIIFQDRLMGIINVESKQPQAFDENDFEILVALGKSLGAILSSVELLEETRRKAQLGQRLNRLMAQFAQVSSVEEILKTVSREVSQLPEVSKVSVHLQTSPNEGQPKALGTSEEK
jgi:sigma-B regulation protein RsbU (phosphoserine phosphatase)